MRLGVQRPRISHVPEYVSSSGDEAIELAAMAGLVLDDWQQFVLRHSLGERADGKWASPTVGLVVCRQSGKNAILEARELAGLFLLGERVIVHSAHEQATASEQFRRLRERIEDTPELKSRVASVVRGKGSEAIELKSGQRILFKPRTGAGGRGFTVDLIVFDEAMILTEESRSALIPSMSARSIEGNTQTWYTGSAGDQENPKHQPLVLARIREAGLKGTHGLAYFEWSSAGEDPGRVTDDMASDPEIWAQANPGLGIRISEEAIERERTVDMGPREFAVERLGVGDWPDTSQDAGRAISLASWAQCAEHDRSKRITSSLVYAVDVNPDRTWAAIGVAGERDDGLFQVAVVDHRRGTDWVVSKCVELMHDDATLVFDARGPAAPLIDDLENAGVHPVLMSTADYGIACGMFFDAVDHVTVRFPFPQPELDDALSSGRKKPLGDQWKWARKSPTSSDITPLVAVTLAHWGARTQGAPQVWDLNEIVERLRREQSGEPAAVVPANASVTLPEAPAGTRFVSLEDMPSQGRWR